MLPHQTGAWPNGTSVCKSFCQEGGRAAVTLLGCLQAKKVFNVLLYEQWLMPKHLGTNANKFKYIDFQYIWALQVCFAKSIYSSVSAKKTKYPGPARRSFPYLFSTAVSRVVLWGTETCRGQR